MIDVNQLENLHWRDLDILYTYCRRKLFKTPKWRYGTQRVYDVAKRTYHRIAQYTSIGGTNYCEVGCGTYHPFGIAAIMYLNGANSITVIDKKESDHQRAAEALYDLLMDCATLKDKWLWSECSVDRYYQRINEFNLAELRSGNLFAGVKDINYQYIIGDIQEKLIIGHKIDILSSWAILEHVEHFEMALQNLYDNMSNGGIAFHLIDLRDHRAYRDTKYNFWSFLTEDGSFDDFNCNRLRANEILSIINGGKLKVLDVDFRKGRFPRDIQCLLLPKYKTMTVDELETVALLVTLRK